MIYKSLFHSFLEEFSKLEYRVHFTTIDYGFTPLGMSMALVAAAYMQRHSVFSLEQCVDFVIRHLRPMPQIIRVR